MTLKPASLFELCCDEVCAKVTKLEHFEYVKLPRRIIKYLSENYKFFCMNIKCNMEDFKY